MMSPLRRELTDVGLALYEQAGRVPRPQQDDLFFHLTRLLDIGGRAIRRAERNGRQSVRRRRHRQRLCFN